MKRSLPVLLALLFITLSFGSVLALEAVGQWVSGLTLEAVTGPVNCLHQWNGMLVVGGEFDDVCATGFSNLAFRDGENWQQPPDSPIGNINALITYGGSLIVAGEFVIPGENLTINIARWDGVQWHSLNIGLFGNVHALTLFEGDLIVGGEFTTSPDGPVSRVARWDGEHWSALGMGFDHNVYALGSFAGELYAGGQFMMSGSEITGSIARWDGAAWQPLENGTNGIVYDLAVYDNELYVGGAFQSAGSSFSDNIARWDGSQFLNVGLGLDIPFGADNVKTMCVHNGLLYIGGRFRDHAEETSLMIACWDGSSWQDFNPGMNDGVESLIVYGGELFAGGQFTHINSVAISYLASTEGLVDHFNPTWSGFQGGLADPPRDMISFDSGIVACGMNSSSGHQIDATSIWNGGRWRAMPLMRDGVDFEYKYSLLDFEGELVVGGVIDCFPGGWGTLERAFAHWRDGSWLLNYESSGLVATEMIDFGGELAAVLTAYEFVSGDGHGPIVNSRVRLMDSGTIGMTQGRNIYALCDFQGDLVIGGDFTDFETCAQPYLAYWDGDIWSTGPFDALDDIVRTLLNYKGLLIAAGDFVTGSGRTLNRIARWNGYEWLPYGDGLNGRVHCITPYRDGFVVGGTFPGYVAFWDGVDWIIPDGGTNGPVYNMAVSNGRLYLAGNFTEAGGHRSDYFACWEGEVTPVTVSSFDVDQVAGGVEIRWMLGAASTNADFRLQGSTGTESWQVDWREESHGVYVAHDGERRDGADDGVSYHLYMREGTESWQLLCSDTIRYGAAPLLATLHAPHPNPFNPKTSISFALDRDQEMRLEIFAPNGRRVRLLRRGHCLAGEHVLDWDGRDDSGQELASGVYLLRLAAEDTRDTKRLVLLR
ncbi:MAG: hypothetical protein GY835_17565 [bacterium]|nr:hypothetical protein [bacterium]